MITMQMTGHDRTYRLPRSIRVKAADTLPARTAAGEVSAWDLFALEQTPDTQDWAAATIDGLIAAADAEAQDARGCIECEDTGFYGITAGDDPDLLIGLVRRVGDAGHERLTADGSWEPWTADEPAEILDLDLAGDLAAALTAGACGLLRRYAWPQAFLSPEVVVAATTVRELISPENTTTPHSEWVNYGVVDPVDVGAVLDVVRIQGPATAAERLVDGLWSSDDAVLRDPSLTLVPLPATVLAEIQARVASGLPKQQVCAYCSEQATKRIMHSEGMAYIPVCSKHLDKGIHDAEHCTPGGTVDPSNVTGVRDIPAVAAGGLTADAPLTVSPDPRAEKLRRYWSTGRGAAKIRWNTPGDWKRCVRYLSKYMGLRAKGYCQNLHKRNDGVWTGDRRNPGGNGRRGRGLFSSISNEAALLASLRSGHWTGPKEEGTDMADTLLKDGIYCEVTEADAGIQSTITAGGFPVSPPKKWFENPGFSGPTPMKVDDDGKVYGHVATWDSIHIGMAGAVRAPKSRSGYAYFLTGELKTEEGDTVNVGQLTLAGGHASLQADSGSAVKHYDDTNSAVADVTVGEDRYGIWAAGSLRPNITPEQVRVFRASPLSGDWRPIGGRLELVAACAVNVPGFPIARARVAGGAIVALVAAGAHTLAVLQSAMTAELSVVQRLEKLEAQVAAVAAPSDVATVDLEPEVVPAIAEPVAAQEVSEPAEVVDKVEPLLTEEAAPDTAEKVETAEQEPAAEQESLAEAARKEVKEFQAQLLREQVESLISAGAVMERKGGGYPISDEASLRDAIQAYGRSRPQDRAKTRAHIMSAARKLGLTKLIPIAWDSSTSSSGKRI